MLHKPNEMPVTIQSKWLLQLVEPLVSVVGIEVDVCRYYNSCSENQWSCNWNIASIDLDPIVDIEVDVVACVDWSRYSSSSSSNSHSSSPSNSCRSNVGISICSENQWCWGWKFNIASIDVEPVVVLIIIVGVVVDKDTEVEVEADVDWSSYSSSSSNNIVVARVCT